MLSKIKTVYISTLSINFHEFNIHSSLAQRKYFNNEIFPNYGMHYNEMLSGDYAVLLSTKRASFQLYTGVHNPYLHLICTGYTG